MVQESPTCVLWYLFLGLGFVVVIFLFTYMQCDLGSSPLWGLSLNQGTKGLKNLFPSALFLFLCPSLVSSGEFSVSQLQWSLCWQVTIMTLTWSSQEYQLFPLGVRWKLPLRFPTIILNATWLESNSSNLLQIRFSWHLPHPCQWTHNFPVLWL